MWWRSAPTTTWPRIVAVALLVATLAGCGFRPLYGTHANDPGIAADLSAIYVRPLPDRDGQLVHNALLVRFNPSGEPRHARYRLETNLAVNEQQVALSKDETASRASVSFEASYTLFEGEIALTAGNVSRIYSYDYVPQQYSNITARSDVARRAAEEIAGEIGNRIATYFIAAAKARAKAQAAPGANP
jgi:LPS-assembly lipoprotein